MDDSGIAQGGIVDTPDGEWYAILFGDRGAVGRIPYLIPVTWEDGWPVFGVNGKVPVDTGIPLDFSSNIVASDEFNQRPEKLGAYHTVVPERVTTVQSAPMEGLGRDIIVNGGFENGLTGWAVNDSAKISISNEIVFSGTSSLHITERKSVDSGVKQDLTGKLAPGKHTSFQQRLGMM